MWDKSWINWGISGRFNDIRSFTGINLGTYWDTWDMVANGPQV